ncbi:MAG: GntR family transcriptional regulator, partial [Herbinix sp.]|nr:GntR family transcriptional regulator [Herbinix sp.]
MSILNKDSSEPLYKQLVDEIKDQIAKGELKENERIFTELELSEKYDVSRITVRKAVTLLVDEGILVKQHGIGTFVA